ncbi:MAG: MFS transporter [Candidatus Omnitrophota bacterium]
MFKRNRKLRQRYPKLNKRLFWIFALSSAVYFTQGIEALPAQGLFYYLKETLNFSPQKIMYLGSITTLAWLVKPFIGYLIDNYFDKRRWIFIALFLDIAVSLFLGMAYLPLFILISFLVFNSANSAFRDVAVDGIMCVEGKAYGATGKIQSVQWISISLAGLFSGIGGGYIAEKWGYRQAFLWLIPVYLLVGLTACFYRENSAARIKMKQRFLPEMKKLFYHKKLLIIALFIFLYRFSPAFGTPLFFIQRDNFGWTKIWIGALATISTVFSVCGALLYYRFSSRIRIKKWLFYSVFLGAFVSLSYLYYTPLTAVIYDILYSLIGMFIFLMVMDFMARSTISGLEATSFALLCSFSNLSLVASNLSGAFLLPRIGLKGLIILSSLTSFLCLLLIKKIGEPAIVTSRVP